MNKKRIASVLAVGALAAGGMVLAGTSAATAQPVCVSDGISRTIDPTGVPTYQNDATCGELYQYGPQPEVAPVPQLPAENPFCDGSGVVSHIVCGSPAPGEWIEEGGWLHYYPAVPAEEEEELPEGTVTVGEVETVWVGDSGFGYGGGFGFGGGFFDIGFFGGSVTGGGTVTVGDPDPIGEFVIQ